MSIDIACHANPPTLNRSPNDDIEIFVKISAKIFKNSLKLGPVLNLISILTWAQISTLTQSPICSQNILFRWQIIPRQNQRLTLIARNVIVMSTQLIKKKFSRISSAIRKRKIETSSLILVSNAFDPNHRLKI